jgi:hypothetical protein
MLCIHQYDAWLVDTQHACVKLGDRRINGLSDTEGHMKLDMEIRRSTDQRAFGYRRPYETRYGVDEKLPTTVIDK